MHKVKYFSKARMNEFHSWKWEKSQGQFTGGGGLPWSPYLIPEEPL